jgi:Protein of unknown function (DUF3592)
MIIKAFLALTALAFLILSAGLAIWVAFTLRYALRRNAWKTTPGVVTDSRVVSNRRANGLPGHHYRVGYEFSIEGEEYRGTRVRLGDFRYLTRATAERTAARYPEGASVVVHYDASFRRDHPEREPVTVLEPGFNAECLYPIAVLAVTLGVVAFCVASLFG